MELSLIKNTSVSIRPYQKSDLPGCLSIFDQNTPRFFDPTERGDFGSFLHTLGVPFLVAATNHGNILGCGGYYTRPETQEGRICWGMVDPTSHHRGIGSQLLKARLNELLKLPNMTRITLDTSLESCGFFMRHGFNTCAVTPNGIAPGRDMVSMVLLNQSTSPQI